MSVSTVVSLGYGSFGNISYVTTLGYDSVEAARRGGSPMGRRKKRHKMSSSNKDVDYKGKNITNMGKPKDARYGAETGRDAVNKISGPAGLLTKEQSPSPFPQSRNQNKKTGGTPNNNPKGKGRQ